MAAKGSIRPDVAFRYLKAGRDSANKNFGVYFCNKDGSCRKQATEYCRTQEEADRVKKRLEDLNPGKKIMIKNESIADITSRIDLFLINEATAPTKIKNMAQLVKVLQGSDFGMSKAGGNGYAMNKGGKLVLHDPFWVSPKGPELERKRNDWLEGGTYYNYFKDEYGITFGNVKVETIYDSKKYGPNSGGYTQLTIDVLFGVRESLMEAETPSLDQIAKYLTSKGFELTKTSTIDFYYTNKKTKKAFKVDDYGQWGYSRLDGAGNILKQGKGLPGIKKLVEEA